MPTKKLYSAYGSNMDLPQMEFRCPCAKPLKVARLEGHRFIINPRGVASIVESPDHHVEGLLWELTDECEASLDIYEGIKEGHYQKKMIHVNEMGETPVMVYIGSQQEAAYVARDGYFEKILRAAKAAGLSEKYIQDLQCYYDQCQDRKNGRSAH